MSAAKDTQNLLFAGDYRTLLERFFDGSARKVPGTALSPVIAALASTGRFEEAEALLAARGESLSEDAHVLARYYLGLNALRIPQFPKARAYFAANHRARPKSETARFFVCQGLALRRYYEGQVESAAFLANRALRHAADANFAYGRVLAGDLVAHTEFRRGRANLGLQHLEGALRLAERLGYREAAASLNSSFLVRQAQHGLLGGAATDNLAQALRAPELQEGITRANLSLELARLLTLRGSWAAADATLQACLPKILAHRLSRQEAVWNLRASELCYQRGQLVPALNHARMARSLLQAGKPEPTRLAALGQENKLLAALELDAGLLAEGQAQLARLSIELRDERNDRIRRREQGSLPSAFGGHDPQGDLLDRVRGSSAHAVAESLASGFYSLLYQALPLKRGECVLALELERNSITLLGPAGVHHLPLGRSRQTRELLAALCRRSEPWSKAELAQEIWGYAYHPLRHDPVIYATILNCRRALGPYAAWLVNTEQGYALERGVRVYRAPLAKNEKVPATGASEPAARPELNYRQATLLGVTSTENYFDADSVAKRFRVSRVTASRDLSELVQLGLLRRSGRARATRYAKLAP